MNVGNNSQIVFFLMFLNSLSRCFKSFLIILFVLQLQVACLLLLVLWSFVLFFVPLQGGVDLDIWKSISQGVVYFGDCVYKVIWEVCYHNVVCLAFLSVTFCGLGVSLLRRIISAFGRGRA